ncbi:BTAD domain-containing putative transcriptional regulator [Nonomuraea sp. ZG12]|uniref:AfsR/SARP family transcriptional regulator n=1 Tax=Nonomuraea sp. ZG12 TaxID=3452207 RepID=UPI003F8AA697
MRLRKELAHSVGGGVGIHTEGGGYRLTLGQDRVDVLVFRQLVQQALEEERQGRPAAAVKVLRQAEELWRGPAFVDVPSEALHRDEAIRVTEDWARAVEHRIDLELSIGFHSDHIGELRELTVRYPLRERFWWQLIFALYHDNRQVEALDCYREARTLFMEEFGLEPGEELQRLHQQIFDHEVPAKPIELTGAGDEVRPVPAPASWVPQCQLPPDTADFVGRADEIHRIEKSLVPSTGRTAVPVVVISGPPGVGKSALATRVAHRLRRLFPDGQWYAQLSGSKAGEVTEDALSALLQLSGVDPHSVPGGALARSAALRARLADRRVLLILDQAANLDQVLPFMPNDPGCAVIVTSQRMMAGLPGAVQLNLGALPWHEAEEFFTGLVGQRVRDEPDAMREIVSLCGRLPLALRIAGARLASRPDTHLADFACKLRDRRRLDELQTVSMELRAGLELSYLALSEGARRAFRMLGLLDGSDFPEWVLATLLRQKEAELPLEELFVASLLAPAGRDRTGEPRYRMHDLLLVYAADLAAMDPESERRAALRQLLDAFLQIELAAWSRNPRVLWGRPPGAPATPTSAPLSQDRLARLLARPLALDESMRQLVVFLVERASELGWYEDAGRLAGLICVTTDADFNRMHQAVKTAAYAAGDEQVWHQAEFALARRLVHQRPEEAVRRLTACLEAFQRFGAQHAECHTLVWLSMCHTMTDQVLLARRFAARALALAKTLDQDTARTLAVPDFVSALATDRHRPEVLSSFQRAWETAERLGDSAHQWMVLNGFTSAARDAGDLERAVWAAERGLALSETYGEGQASAWMLVQLARVRLDQGDLALATAAAEQAQEIYARDHDQHGASATDEILRRIHARSAPCP